MLRLRHKRSQKGALAVGLDPSGGASRTLVIRAPITGHDDAGGLGLTFAKIWAIVGFHLRRWLIKRAPFTFN